MFSATVIENIRLTNSTFMLSVEKPDIEIKAGQCFNVGTIDEGVNREYSMYSNSNGNRLEFLIREIEDGIVSSKLGSLKQGDLVELSGPYGEFCIQNSIDSGVQDFVFIGTGTGIAPFRSFIKTFPEINYQVIHGIRYANENYHQNDYKNHSYVPCISRPDNGSPPQRVTDYLQKMTLNKTSTIYICGNRKMITEVFDLCRGKGVNGNQIFTEVFF